MGVLFGSLRVKLWRRRRRRRRRRKRRRGGGGNVVATWCESTEVLLRREVGERTVGFGVKAVTCMIICIRGLCYK
jgi:hypothetical protein